MSTILSTGALTLADWAKRVEDEKIAVIINILSQQNAILEDMLWIEGNLPTGHKTTIRTGLPSATWRLFNAGVQPTKSTTAQVVDTCGMLETYSDIDCALAELGGDPAQLRLSEDLAFIEGMNQQLASALFYSNALATPQQIMGLSPRYNTVLTTSAQSANNVIDGSGTGSVNTSLWLLSWGPNNMTGIFPKGSMSGLQMKDLGEQTLYTHALQMELRSLCSRLAFRRASLQHRYDQSDRGYRRQSDQRHGPYDQPPADPAGPSWSCAGFGCAAAVGSGTRRVLLQSHRVDVSGYPGTQQVECTADDQ